MNKFGERSSRKLQGVKPELVLVAQTALQISKIDFGVTEGLRSLERQRQLVDTGASQTMKSRHITGDAVDVIAFVNGKYSYDPLTYTGGNTSDLVSYTLRRTSTSSVALAKTGRTSVSNNGAVNADPIEANIFIGNFDNV